MTSLADIDKLTEDVERINDAWRTINRGRPLFDPSDGAGWTIRSMTGIAREFFAQQPFQIGDRIKLAADFKIPDRPYHGWHGREDILFPGSVGTVVIVSWNEVYKYVSFVVELDAESPDKNGRHWFGMTADQIGHVVEFAASRER